MGYHIFFMQVLSGVFLGMAKIVVSESLAYLRENRANVAEEWQQREGQFNALERSLRDAINRRIGIDRMSQRINTLKQVCSGACSRSCFTHHDTTGRSLRRIAAIPQIHTTPLGYAYPRTHRALLCASTAECYGRCDGMYFACDIA